MFFYKTALHIAIQNENEKIVKLLLSCDKTDVNLKKVLKKLCFNIISK